MVDINTVDVAIVGAGPAGLFAALETSRAKLNTIVIEQGNAQNVFCRSYSKQVFDLTLCEPKCRHYGCLQGLGGAALHFESTLDNYQLGKSKPSESLLNAFGGDSNDLELIVNDVFETFSKHGLALESSEPTGKMGCQDQKHHCSTVSANFQEVKSIISGITQELNNMGTKILSNNSLANILFDGSVYELQLKTKQGLHTLKAKQIVFATGKRSFEQLLSFADKVGVKYVFPKEVELGVRVETTREFLKDLFKESYNPKIKYTDESGSSTRSFCFCDGGRIMQYTIAPQYPAHRILDGQHAHTQAGIKTNFAILTKRSVPEGSTSIEFVLKYIADCTNLVIDSIPGQLYSDFSRNCRSSDHLIQSVHSTLADVKSGNIRAITDQYFVAVKEFLEYLSATTKKEIPDTTLILAPAVERYVPIVEVNANFQSNVRGLYFVGDCSGRVFGIVSAAASGTKVGRFIARGNTHE